MGVTLRDIANEAGVTTSTVSRALNNKGGISHEVKRRILDIADRQNYRRKTQSNVISYVIDKRFFTLTSHFYNRVIEGIEEVLKEHSFSFQFNSLESERFSLEGTNIGNVAGMIVTSAYHDDFIVEVKKSGIPIVLLDHHLPTEYIDSVLIDNTEGVMVGMRYLQSLGHERIVYLAGDMKTTGSIERLAGYRRAVEAFKLVMDEALILECDFSIQSAYEKTKAYIRSAGKMATAVMAVNDVVAIGAMEAIKESNLSIPDQVSVLGFDDIDLSRDVIPKLSTMNVSKKMIGRLAADRLVQIINGSEPGLTKTMLRPTLLVRESTGKLR
jgi:DNA-binding LacI/PurR family transcriptional regulator